MNATKTLLATARETLNTGIKPITRAQADAAASADGYSLQGADGSISLRHGIRLVGTYSTVRGALRALVADEAGIINRDRRPPQPRARHD